VGLRLKKSGGLRLKSSGQFGKTVCLAVFAALNRSVHAANAAAATATAAAATTAAVAPFAVVRL